MNYKALYRTYRPINFAEVQGQDHIVRTLSNLINLKKISHAYLFSGPRGTGKTSVAKIFANIINCSHNNNELNVACGSCLLTINNSIDTIEIDAASNNGINEIRELREKVKFAPTKFKYKVYIIDEVHMLTKGAFNALLKTLEEPPKHVIFILATTDPDKLPLTILSRVQRYNFKKIANNVVQKQIRFIFEKENIKSESGVVEVIANLANGSLRDALSIVDQINAYSNLNIKLADINDIFGLTSNKNKVMLVNFCVGNFVAPALKLFNELIDKGIDIRRLINSLINLLKEYLLFIKTKDESLIKEFDIKILNSINMQEYFVYEFIDILIILLQDIKYSDIPQQLFQIAIIKICALNSHENMINLNTVKSNDIKDIDSIEIPQKNNIKNNVDISEITDNFIIKGKQEDFNRDDKDMPNFRNAQNTNLHTDIINNEEKMLQEVTDILTLSNESNIDGDVIEGSILGQTQTNPEALIYDTNELLINQDEHEKQEQQKENTKKINDNDIENTKSFNIKNEISDKFDFSFNEEKSEKVILTQPDIINLFLLGDKENIKVSKIELAEALLSTNAKYAKIISYLENSKIITASRNFILFSSDDNAIIDFLIENSKDEILNDFMYFAFGVNRHIYAITKNNFLDSADLFKELKANDKLPEPTQLPFIKRTKTEEIKVEELEAEKKGFSVFGGIFNKRK